MPAASRFDNHRESDDDHSCDCTTDDEKSDDPFSNKDADAVHSPLHAKSEAVFKCMKKPAILDCLLCSYYYQDGNIDKIDGLFDRIKQEAVKVRRVAIPRIRAILRGALASMDDDDTTARFIRSLDCDGIVKHFHEGHDGYDVHAYLNRTISNLSALADKLYDNIPCEADGSYSHTHLHQYNMLMKMTTVCISNKHKIRCKSRYSTV